MASDAGGGGGEDGLVVVVIVVIVVFAIVVGTTLVSVRCLVCREGLVVVDVVARDMPSLVVVFIRPGLGGSLLPSSTFAPWAAPRPRAFGLRALMRVFLGGCRRCECPGAACRVPVLDVVTLRVVGRTATPTTALLLLLPLPRLSPDLLVLAELLPRLSRATAAASRPPPSLQGGDDGVKLRQAIASAEKTTADRRMGRRTVVVTARCRVEDTM
jgi:hypothetical protein